MSAYWTDGLTWRRKEEMTTEKQAEWWMGFACKKCNAPLAVQRLDDPSKSGATFAAGWRVTCPSCGETEYYERGSQTKRIKISNRSTTCLLSDLTNALDHIARIVQPNYQGVAEHIVDGFAGCVEK